LLTIIQQLCSIKQKKTYLRLSIEKLQVPTPQGAKTPEPILMKLGIIDYVRDTIPQDNFGVVSATWVVWANM